MLIVIHFMEGIVYEIYLWFLILFPLDLLSDIWQ